MSRAWAALALTAAGCFTGAPQGEAGESSGVVVSVGESSGSGGSSSSGDGASAGSLGSTGGPTGEPTGVSGEATTADETAGEGTTMEEGTTTGAGTTGAAEDECPRVRVTVAPGEVLNIRPEPSTAQAPVGTLPAGAIVDVVGVASGESIEGNDQWFEITSTSGDGFVWSGLAECTLDEPPELQPPSGFWLPLACGTKATVSQGNFGGFSHQGTSAYAFDFSLGTGTPLVAIADGEVIYIYDKTKPGDPCYNGGGQECSGKANLVTLLHGDGTTSAYVHLSEVGVGVGAFVPRGQAVGLSGSSGWSTGRHAHVQRQEKCNWGFCQSIAVTFADVAGDGVPKTGQTVTSGNCP